MPSRPWLATIPLFYLLSYELRGHIRLIVTIYVSPIHIVYLSLTMSVWYFYFWHLLPLVPYGVSSPSKNPGIQFCLIFRLNIQRCQYNGVIVSHQRFHEHHRHGRVSKQVPVLRRPDHCTFA